MPDITLVTGNKGKLEEYAALLPKNSSISITTHKLDLTEIQSMDLQEIVEDKLSRAYAILQTPVIVEDVSAGLDQLQGLPGPFFKFFEEKLGPTALLKLAGKSGAPLTITCTTGYFDGQVRVFGTGVVRGTLSGPRGANGFGFDPIVVPNGQTRTFAEMSPDEKNTISHRALAIQDLFTRLADIKILR